LVIAPKPVAAAINPIAAIAPVGWLTRSCGRVRSLIDSVNDLYEHLDTLGDISAMVYDRSSAG